MQQKLDYGHFTLLNLTSTTSYYKGICVCVQERHTMRGRRTEREDKKTQKKTKWEGNTWQNRSQKGGNDDCVKGEDAS